MLTTPVNTQDRPLPLRNKLNCFNPTPSHRPPSVIDTGRYFPTYFTWYSVTVPTLEFGYTYMAKFGLSTVVLINEYERMNACDVIM